MKKSGSFRVRLEASIQSTIRGSAPFVKVTEPIPMTGRSSIDAVKLVKPAGPEPIPYGTAMDVQVDGNDLWEDVVLTAVDANRH